MDFLLKENHPRITNHNSDLPNYKGKNWVITLAMLNIGLSRIVKTAGRDLWTGINNPGKKINTHTYNVYIYIWQTLLLVGCKTHTVLSSHVSYVPMILLVVRDCPQLRGSMADRPEEPLVKAETTTRVFQGRSWGILWEFMGFRWI